MTVSYRRVSRPEDPPCSAYSYLLPAKLPAATDLFTVSIVSHFQNVIEYVAFLDWLPSLSSVHFLGRIILHRLGGPQFVEQSPFEGHLGCFRVLVISSIIVPVSVGRLVFCLLFWSSTLFCFFGFSWTFYITPVFLLFQYQLYFFFFLFTLFSGCPWVCSMIYGYSNTGRLLMPKSDHLLLLLRTHKDCSSHSDKSPYGGLHSLPSGPGPVWVHLLPLPSCCSHTGLFAFL